ncbi:hypothetical protein ACOMHN_038493 [Nucella lapillus]
MGSGLSGCSTPSSVHVISISCRGQKGVVHSDSCDSGISVGESQIREDKGKGRSGTLRHDVDSEEEDGVMGHDVSAGRHGMVTPSRSRLTGGGVPVMEEYGSMTYSGGGYDSRKHRTRRTRGPGSKSFRHQNHTSPTLLDDAIDEEDEEVQDGEVRAPRPPRIKSTHFRKSRSHTPRINSKTHGDSGGESSVDVSSHDGEDEDYFDPDILSIPDETGSQRLRPDHLAALMLGQRQRLHGSGSLPNQSGFSPLLRPDSTDWWLQDDCGSDQGPTEGRLVSLPRQQQLHLQDGRVSKKSSERSISSILLTTAVELDSGSTTPVPAATNHRACFALTNPEITQHILKVSNSQRAAASLAYACMRNLIRTSSGNLQDVTVSKSTQDFDRKLREIFLVRPASEDEKKETENLSKKLHDLFVVKNAQKETKSPEHEKGEEIREALESSRDSPSHQTILVSSAAPGNIRRLKPPTQPRSLLVSSRSESAIDLERGKRPKKKVSFSPEVPEVTKCSKNYRRRTIAKLRMAREMRSRGSARLAVFKPRRVSGYVCALCKKDCIGIDRQLKRSLQEIEQELRAATLSLCGKAEVTRHDYRHAVTSLRPRFLRMLGEFKMAHGEIHNGLSGDCQQALHLEDYFAQRLLDMARNSRGALELSPLIKQHLQDFEELCDRQVTMAHRPIRPLVMPADRI